jgi:hypothetical protein
VFHETILLSLLSVLRKSMTTHDGRRRRDDSGEDLLHGARGNEVLGYLPVRQKETASKGYEKEASSCPPECLFGSEWGNLSKKL